MSRPVDPAAVGPSVGPTAPAWGPVVLAWGLAVTCLVAAGTGLLLDSAEEGLVRWKWLVLAVAISVPGALIAAARPRALLGWLLVALALNFSLTGLARAWVRYAGDGDPGLTAVAVWYGDRFGAIALPIAVMALTILPDSRLPGPRWRAPVAAVVLVQGALVVAWSFSATPAAGPDSVWPDHVAALDNPVGVLPEAFAAAVSDLAWLLTLPLLLCVAAMVARLRRSHGADRSRLVMLLLALGVLVGAILGGYALGSPLDEVVELLASLFFGLVLVSAVLRRQLEGVSFVVHHAFVFTTLGAVVVGVYVLAVATLAATGPDLSRFGSGVVAAVAALLVQPLRVRLQRWVDRLMHGDRRDPFQAVSRLAEGTHRAPSVQGVLAAVASSLATSLRVPQVRVEAFGRRAQHPPSTGSEDDTGTHHHAPLVAGDRTVGDVAVTLQPGRRLRADEQRLLAELGRHAGLAVDSVRLAAEVAEHHREVIAAREEERRRLGRELHDDLGPTVASLSMQLGALRPLVRRDPEAVVARLARLEQSASAALADIRRVAHELRPPVLDQLGLAPSIRQMAESLDLEVVEEAVEEGPLPAAVELAAYRIAAEALTNVARHSGTRSLRLELRDTGGCLVLVVADHGRGFDPAGSGLGRETMRERAEELGGSLTVRPGPSGGTVVTAVLPLTPSAAHPAPEGER